MQNTTADYKLEINKPSRSFECKITIGDNIYTNEDLVNLTLEYIQLQEGFSIGGTISQSLDLTLLNNGDIIYSTSQIKVEIGLKIDSKIEYILMGIFNIDEIEKTDYTTKFTAYDNMMKFETAYFSELGNKPTLKQVVTELEKKTGLEFTGSLPDYTVSKLDGFSCREILSYVASICGGNAFITRDGKFTIKSLSEAKKAIDGNNYFNYKREEVKYKIGQVSCQVDGNNILSKGSIGTDSMELAFENPWITETILTEIYNKLKSVEYLGYSMKWQGDLSLDPYDMITVTDVKNVVRNIPILSQKITYTGGLTSEIGAKGETKNKNSFSSSGSTTNKVDRLVIEQAVIKDVLIDKANIKDLEASNAKIENLEVKIAKIEEAYIKDLNALNANIENLIASNAIINNAVINKADITELNAVKATIKVLEVDTANIKNLLAGNITGENIQAGGITSDKLTIANGFITNAMIANLDVAKINAGNISTNKFRIVSDSGKMLIADNTIQIRDNNRARVQIGKDASNDYNMYIWDKSGKLMFDATGLKADGIKNKIIRDDMISDNANIGGSKINIGSLVTEINKDTNTSVIKSSKIQLDTAGQTLDIAFNSLKSQADGTKNLTESNSTTIGVMQGQISTAINNTQIIKDGKTTLLKDDYNRTVAKVDSINSTIGTHTTKIDQLTGNITSVDTKVNSVQRDLEGTKSTVSSHTTQINGLNSTVSTQGSSINQLKDEITLKVEASDITNAVNNIQVGGRNLLVKNALESGNISGANGAVITGTYTNFYRTKNFIDIENGSKYTLKVNKGASGDIIEKIVAYNSTGAYISTHTIKAKQTVFTPPANCTKIKFIVIIANANASTIIESFKIKLEKGTKATDWTAAPEDVDNAINNVNSKVESTKNQVASIETNLSGITQRVSATETTTTALTSKVNTAQSTADSKAKVFTSTPKVPYKVGDLWVGGPYGEVMRCKTSRASGDYTESDWQKASKYTDDTKANAAQSTANNANNIANANKNEITTTKNKVSTIETNLNSITSRVSSTESKVTTINGNITSLQSRMNTAEQSITPTAITSTISSAINNGSGSINTTSTILDKTGFTVKNGAIKIQNKAGSTVLSGDSKGNLTITGNLKSQNGEQYVAMSSGGIDFKDAHRNEQLMRVGIASFSANRDQNGVNFALAQCGDYIRFSHIAKNDLTNGWTSSDKQYTFMDMWQSDVTIGGISYKKGINVYSPMFVNNGIQLFSGTDYPSEILGAVSWDNGLGTIWNMMGLYGDNGAALGYKNGSNLNARIVVTEGAHPGTGDHIKSWGNWNCSGYTVHNATFTGRWVNSYANFTARTLTETTCIEAEHKQVRVNFEDIQLQDGKAILNIPKRYMHINTGYTIASIVKKGKGDVWVAEELENRFIIEGTEDIKVNIEIIIYLENESLYATRKADNSQLCIDMSTGQPEE